MRIIKTPRDMIRRALLWIFGTPALLSLTYLAAAVAGAIIPAPHSTAPVAADQSEIELYLLRGPIHYDLLLPNTAQTQAVLGWVQAQGVNISNPQAKWLVVGWGSQAFYTATDSYLDLKAKTIWRAASGDHAVIRVSLAGTLPLEAPVSAIPLSRPHYARLLDTINASFSDGPATRALAHPGLSKHDRFFPAKGHFNIFNTCNVWIGRTLRRAGLTFGAWTPTPYAVTLSRWIWHAR